MNNRNDFYRLARKSLAGLNKFSATLNITHCTPEDLGTLVDSADASALTFDSTRDVKHEAYKSLRMAREECDPFIENCRNHLMSVLGARWSEKWTVAGFSSRKLALPLRDADRLATLSRLKTYFTNNPGHVFPALNLDAAHAAVCFNNLTEATNAVTDSLADRRSKRDARDTTETALETKLRCLWSELESLLAPTDSRWLQFIDRIPGDPRVPEPVADVTANAQPGGIIQLDWDDSSRAARYKVLKQVVGVDATPVLVTTVEDSDATVTLPGVTPGATVKLQVVATNAVGDASPSEVVQLQAA